MGAAVNAIAFLHIVTDDATPTIFALGREGVNSAFEAIEDVLFARHDHFKRFLVIVSANFTLSHMNGSCLRHETGLSRSFSHS